MPTCLLYNPVMTDPEPSFEVEIRCRFDTYNQACESLPFLPGCLQRGTSYSWRTGIYGLGVFKSGSLLRAGRVVKAEGARRWLGWKGPDLGSFANIRQEIDEDFSTGITNSLILKRLGGKEHLASPEAVIMELQRLGHHEFMAFGGNDTSGYDDQTEISVKMMNCPSIKWPLMVELEKSAATMAEALKHEHELYKLSQDLNLKGWLVREEPPTLLFSSLFPG